MTERETTVPLIAADYPEHTDASGVPQPHWWELDVKERSDGLLTERVYGRLLGFASSHEEDHTDHRGEFADPTAGERCSACRWVDVAIYDIREDPAANKRYRGALYLVHTVGRSDVPGEVDRPGLVKARNAPLVLEGLTQRSKTGRVYLTVPAGQAMAEASAYDEALARVWETRRVV